MPDADRPGRVAMVRTAIKIVLVILLLFVAGRLIRGQAAEEKLPSFDVISVKADYPETETRTNSPLGPGDVYVKTGGHFAAQGFPLATYISFAFRLLGSELEAVAAQLPGWALNDHFSIEARTDGDPAKDTKDQMRLMMRSLLTERFGLKSHYETRGTPIFAVTLAKAGKLGRQLRQHSEADSSCEIVLPIGTTQGAAGNVEGGFPRQCGGMVPMQASAPGRFRFGARNVTMEFIARQLTSLGDLGRPAVDQTGLVGKFDFALEFVPDISSTRQGYPDFQPDPNGLTFSQAVREQLGLKLESMKAPSRFLVIDHVERPTRN